LLNAALTVTPPEFSGLSVHLCCFLFPSVKTNGKRGSAVLLLFEVGAYTGFCDFSGDASIASLTDAASDQVDFVLLKNPDRAVMTCCITTLRGGDIYAATHLYRHAIIGRRKHCVSTDWNHRHFPISAGGGQSRQSARRRSTILFFAFFKTLLYFPFVLFELCFNHGINTIH